MLSELEKLDQHSCPNKGAFFPPKGSSEPSSDEEFFGHQISIRKPVDLLNSPDSITEGIFPQLGFKSPNKAEVEAKRHPSPYYYGDLFKNRTESPSKPAPKFTKSLEKPPDTTREFHKTKQDTSISKLHSNQKANQLRRNTERVLQYIIQIQNKFEPDLAANRNTKKFEC
ncbi:hypothetical protein HHI36_023226 [Cryptolaemus montrouzieri]|uniref:Uncharacterized protein n=1 Tax=Cryptolaemus montrouzieri TaxID=559131 RepID=A0ABD2PHE7_9CUCU